MGQYTAIAAAATNHRRNLVHRERMAFFTRANSTIPTLPGEEGVVYSEDEWEDDMEERRTPDGRSSKFCAELRRSQRSNSSPATTTCNGPASAEVEEQPVATNGSVVEAKDADTKEVKEEPCYENLPAKKDPENKDNEEAKTEEEQFDFVVDRVLGVQVWLVYYVNAKLRHHTTEIVQVLWWKLLPVEIL